MYLRSAIAVLFVVLALGLGCSAALPQPKRCNTDTQCDSLPGEKEQYQCVEGACQVIQICTSNGDCNYPDAECILGRCQRTDPCTSDAQCKPGLRCLSGHCVRVRVTDELLVLHVTFEPAKDPSEVRDSSSFAQHGAWSGGGAFTKDGYLSQAGQFDGKKAMVLIPEAQQFKPRQMTLTAWVYREVADKGGGIIHFFDDNFRNGYGLEITGEGKASFLVADGNGRHSCVGNTAIPVGRWTQIGGSFDGNLLRCFYNGRIDGTKVWSGELAYETTRKMRLGGRSIEGDTFEGRIDEAKIYPLAQRETFSPDLSRLLYVASADGNQILVIDTVTDGPATTRNFPSPVKGGWPVALSDSGKYLYMWDPQQGQLAMIDVSGASKQVLATASAPNGGGWKDGALATYLPKQNTVWVWGKHLHVFPAFFAEQAKPLASINDLGETFAADVTFLPTKQRFVATHTQKRQLLFFDAVSRKQVGTLDLNATRIPGKQPLAIASLPSEGNLFVSFLDSSELKKYQADAAGNFKETGAFSTKETVPGADGKDVVKKRKIRRLISPPEGAFLYYTFEEPRLLYYQDVVPGLQYRLESWIDQTQDQAISRKIKPLTSDYYPHLHHLGQKLYLQDGSTGRFVVVNTVTHEIVADFQLGSSTMAKRLPIVGVRHPSQPY